MKKVIRITALVLVCLSITVLAAGCSVKGNTYAYDSVKVVKKGNLSDQDVKDLEESAKNENKNISFTFEKDGTFKMSGSFLGISLSAGAGYWKQFGSKLYYHMTNKDFEEKDGIYIGEVKMGKVVNTIEDEDSGAKYEVVFTKK